MKKTLFFVLAVAFCFSLTAQRQVPKEFSKFTTETSCYMPVCDDNSNAKFIPSHRPSQFTPRDGNRYTTIGETYYITATNRNSRNVIDWSPDGKTCAAVWTVGNSAHYRGTEINYFDMETETWGDPLVTSPFTRIEQGPTNTTWLPGWGTHLYTKEGECILSHCTPEGGMLVNIRDKRGEGEWQQSVLKGPVLSDGVTTEVLWASAVAVENTIHMVCCTANDTTKKYHGISMCPLYFRSTDGGKTWEEPKTFEGIMTQTELQCVSGDYYVLTARENHLVLAYVAPYRKYGTLNPTGDVLYLESRDGGDNWERKVVSDCNFPWYAGGTGVFTDPTMYATTVAATIGDDDVVHIAFSATLSYILPITPAGSRSTHYFGDRLFTWNDKHPTMTKEDLGIQWKIDGDYMDFLYWGFDTLPTCMDAPDLLGFDAFQFFWQESSTEVINMFKKNYGDPGYISHPRLLAQNNKVYLTYSSIIEQPMVCSKGEFFRGVFLTVSKDNGETFDQKNNTSWLSYGPGLFNVSWDSYDGPTSDTTYGGTIFQIDESENYYPSMATSIQNNTLVFSWYNDIQPLPEPPTGSSQPWSQYPSSIYALAIPADIAGDYWNTQDIWQNIGSKVEEKETINNLKIYPNPAGNTATIEVGTPNPYTLTVTNIMGQVVHTVKGQQSKVELNVANYPAGIYIVNVKTAHASASQKLIVK